MQTTITIANNLQCSPFEIFEQDTDEVIMLINFFIEYGDRKEQFTDTKNINYNSQKPKRIRVNDKTATGGWF